MNMLAIDVSSRTASAAVFKAERLTGEQLTRERAGGNPVIAAAHLDAGLTHSQTLLPMVDALLQGGALTMEDIDRVAVAVGPGSFTGVRIGVATAKGLAFAQEIPCTPVSTLLGMAYGYAALPLRGILCAALDARRGQVYAAVFALEEGDVRRLTEDAAVNAEVLAAQLPAYGAPVLLTGDGAVLIRQALPDSVACHMLPTINYAAGIAAAAYALDLPAVHPDELRPVYLRLPQAERELRERQGERGL